jgi:hypothetical protein
MKFKSTIITPMPIEVDIIIIIIRTDNDKI